MLSPSPRDAQTSKARNSWANGANRKSKFRDAIGFQAYTQNNEQMQIIDILEKSISEHSSVKDKAHAPEAHTPEKREKGSFLVHKRWVYYDPRSLFIFDESTCFRQSIVWLIEWKWLERFVILIIFLSSITLASYDQTDPDNLTLRNEILQGFQYGFTVIFALEAALKIIGMGLVFHKHAYLRDGWNWLDCSIVILGLLDWIMTSSYPQMPSMKSLRTLRVLRPLRSFNAVPSMKRIIKTLLLSLPDLANVAIFMSFFFIVFGILGVQQFCGYFYYFCRLTPAPVNGTWAIDPDQPSLCSKDSGGLNGCNPMTWCGAPQDYNLPISIDSPDQNAQINFGITTFDNLGRAILTIFQVLTLSDWDYIMYNMMNSNNAWLAVIYFFMVVVFGTWFILNLIMAVFMDSFDKIDEANKATHVVLVHDNVLHTSHYQDMSKDPIENPLSQNKVLPIVPRSETIRSLREFERKRSLSHVGFITTKVVMEEPQREGMNKSCEHPESVSLSNHSVRHNSEPEDQVETIPIQTKDSNIPSHAKSHKLFLFFYVVCSHYIFQGLVMFAIIINTLILALDRYPISVSESHVYDTINLVLTWFFVMEMICKILGLGPKLYFYDKFNRFDFLIVIISLIEMIYDLSSPASSGKGIVSAFRAFRMIRIFKLARSWQSFQVMVLKIGKTIKDVGNYSVLLLIVMFTYSLLGMEFYANSIREDIQETINMLNGGPIDPVNGISPRTNFDTIWSSSTTVYQILIGDGWDNIMYDYVRNSTVQAGPVIYFISLMLIGNLILIKLFSAILLKNFEDDEEGKPQHEDKQEMSTSQRKLYTVAKHMLLLMGKFFKKRKVKHEKDIEVSQSDSKIIIDEDNSQPVKEGVSTHHLVHAQTIKSQSLSLGEQENTQAVVKRQNSRKKSAFMKKVQSEDNIRDQFQSKGKISNLYSLVLQAQRQNASGLEGDMNKDLSEEFKNQTSDLGNQALKLDSKATLNKQIITMKTSKKLQELHYKSLYLFSPQNKVRQFLNVILSMKNFDNVILLVILVSSVILIMENPLSDPDSELNKVTQIVDMIITGIFCLECISKIIVFGFLINGPSSYLRVGWNILDFFIVLISLISYVITGNNLQSLKVLRLLRILRPLRMISRNEGLKLCVKSLLLAIPGIVNVLVLSVIFYFIFGIFFTNLFKGKFKRCYIDPSIQSSAGVSISMIVHKWDCLNYGAEWVDQNNNFNNVLNSIYTLFAISTTDNWAYSLYAGIDATSIDYQPLVDNNYWMALIFCAFTTFGFLFTLNLFMEVVVNTFLKEKDNLEKIHMITDTQKEWVNTQILSLNCRPLKKRINTDNKLRNVCVYIVEGKYFERFILAIIFCNTIALTLYWINIDQSILNVLEKVNYFFVVIFTTEAALKLIAYGKLYFNSGWNWFDFIIVILAWVGIVLKLLSSVQAVATTTLIRTFRICRIFRLIKKAKALNAIFKSLVITLPALGNLGSLLLLIMYLYAILGMNLFADIKLQTNINSNVNFQSFGFSLLALFRLASGDNWQLLMYDCMLQPSILVQCIQNPQYSDYVANNMQTVGCGTPYATLYFVSFTLLVTYIQLNLFLAIIIQGFSDSNAQIDYKITENEIEQFQDIWSSFDPNVSILTSTLLLTHLSKQLQGSGFIKVSELPDLIEKLIQAECTLIPLREVLDSPKEIESFIDYLELHSCNKFQNYHFTDVLNSLCLTSLKISFNEKEEFEKVSLEIFEKFGVTIQNINEMQEFRDIGGNRLCRVAILEQVGESEKVRVCTQLKNKQSVVSSKILKNVDCFDGNFYDSRHIIRMSRAQRLIKVFIEKRREKKKREQMEKEEEEGESLLKNTHYFGIKSNSQISTLLISSSKLNDQQSNLLLNQDKIVEESSNEDSPSFKGQLNISPMITDQVNEFQTQHKEVINFYAQNQMERTPSNHLNNEDNVNEEEEEQESISLIENKSPLNQDIFLDNFQPKQVEFNMIQQDEERGGCIEMEEEEEKTSLEDLIRLQTQQEHKVRRKRSDLSSIDEEKEQHQNNIFNKQLDISFNPDAHLGETEQEKKVRNVLNRRNDNNFESHTLNTPGRARKKHQPQQKDRKKKLPSWTGQNHVHVLSNQQTIVSDSSNQSRRIFFSNQPMANASLTNSRINNADEGRGEDSDQDSSTKKAALNTLLSNLDHKPLQPELLQQPNPNPGVDHLNIKPSHNKSSENSLQMLPSYNEDNYSLTSSQERKLRKENKEEEKVEKEVGSLEGMKGKKSQGFDEIEIGQAIYQGKSGFYHKHKNSQL